MENGTDPLPSSLDYGTRPTTLQVGRGAARRAIGIALGLVGLVLLFFLWALFDREPRNLTPRPDFKGKGLDALVAELGPPALTQRYTVGDAMSMGYRSAVLAEAYPDYDTPAQAGGAIRELVWERSRTRVIVWFHRVDGGPWVGIHGMECNKRVTWLLDRVPTTNPTGPGPG